MRMDPESGASAAEWLSTVDEKTLKRVLREYGEERYAGRIARAIVAARSAAPIQRTLQLAEIIIAAVPSRGERIHPATRSFQAIRIEINNELQQLRAVLEQSVKVLREGTAHRRGGRLCVISFHSLEDRIVKRFFRQASREPEQYRGLPSIPEEYRPKLAVVGGLIRATAEETAANVRARSARLRVAERL